MGHGWRISAMVPAAALLAGVAMLGCPGTLADKQCYVNEERAHAVLVTSCTDGGCHNAKDKSTGLDLESAGVGPRLKGVASLTCTTPLVDPGNADGSALYGKLQDPPPCGSRMPLGRPELFPEDVEAIRVWIQGLDGSCGDAGTTSGAGAGGAGAGGAGAGGAGGTGAGGAGTAGSGAGATGGSGGSGGSGGGL